MPTQADTGLLVPERRKRPRMVWVISIYMCLSIASSLIVVNASIVGLVEARPM